MSVDQSNEQIWLVKSSGVVRGPFHFLELINEVKKRNIALLDEVRTPTARWRFIREQKELADIVKAIREEDAVTSQVTGLTNTAFISEATKSITIDVSPEVTRQTGKADAIIDEKTPIPEFERRGGKGKLPPPEIPTPKTKKAEPEKVPKPIHAIPQSLVHKIQKPKLLYFVPVVIVIIALLLILDFNKSRRLNQNMEELIRNAQQYRTQGLLQKALPFYEKAEATFPLPDYPKKEYLSLMLTLHRGDLAKSNKILNELENSKSKMETPISFFQNWRGMILHLQQNYIDADVEFEKAIAADGRLRAPVLNRIVNDFYARHPDKALQHYNEAKQAQMINHTALLAAALSILNLESSAQVESIQSMLNDLNAWIHQHSEGRSESLFMISALQAHSNQIKESEATIEKLVEMMPKESDDFVQELDVLQTMMNWEDYSSICERLAKTHAGKAAELLVSAYCEIEKGKNDHAWAIIEALQKKFPENNLYVGMQAYLLKAKKNTPEAKVLTSSSNLSSAKMMLIEICIDEKDLDCADSVIRGELIKNPSSIRGLYWSAKVALLRNNKELARTEVNKGLQISPYYLPLLELREDLNAR